MVYNMPLVEKLTGRPNQTFHRWWNESMDQIEAAINGIQDALTAAGIAQAAATAANAAAATANTAADNAAAVTNLAESGTDGLTLTATDAGSDATITISAHDRIYADGTTVSVNGGSVTGLLYSTLYFVYYDDASRAGGAVTYVVTTNTADAVQTGNRHLVGDVTTPVAAGADTDGGIVVPPGRGNIIRP